MTSELDKTFDPAAIEKKWYAHWEANGLFRPHRPEAEPFTLVNPPPNVTGSLHIGHALDNTLQDVVVRYERMRGKDALWVVGTDHAGIATQMVVERQLAERQDKRTNHSRKEFVELVWKWKEESGGEITRQLRRLGCSMDWSREQFTMSPEFTRAVTKVFVDLYNNKDENGNPAPLIYRDKRLVNWDPMLKTAISDLEVEQREVKGHFWHFRYPLEDGGGYIAIATTRPETILGDGAVAVNPDDERYRHLVGKRCRLPIVDRLIPIIADDYVKIDFGSGAVKITAAHDHNDYEVYKRHPEAGIPLINLMNADATMNENCPPDYVGLDRYEARAKVVADFDALGLLDRVEDHVHMVPFGDRSDAVIEPWLTDQWYVDAATLAGPAMEAVRKGAIEIVPKSWEKTFFNWMENIQPWCVSRQLWWGHRIPAWYGPLADEQGVVTSFAEKIFVAEHEDQLRRQAQEYYGPNVTITLEASRHDAFVHPWGVGDRPNQAVLFQDADVLDTWFSSALWPFATLEWPDQPQNPNTVRPEPVEGQSLSSKEKSGASTSSARTGELSLLQRHYPNDLLISGFDILFFWDARMMMQGIHFMKDVPWKRLYLHGLVRAADGQKMSKSKGNVVDPLILIDKYGADALRFFMAAMESQGRDIKMDESRVEGYRNFATKLWNATRFCQANGIGASSDVKAPPATLAVNKWIIGEVVETVASLEGAMAELRFDNAAGTIYHFVWDRFCDWYLELVKGQIDEETKAVAGWVLDQILVMLHPFMPFVTEELWHAQGERPYELILAKWPVPGASVDAEAKAEVETIIEFTSNVRAAKNELGIASGTMLVANVAPESKVLTSVLSSNSAIVTRVSRISEIRYEPPSQGPAAHIGVGAESAFLPLEGVIDIEAEKARLTKSLEASEKEAAALTARLTNPAFIERAKPEAVEKARADHAHHAAEAERLAAALARLG